MLTATELALVDQMAELTQSKRTDVIKSALSACQHFEGGGKADREQADSRLTMPSVNDRPPTVDLPLETAFSRITITP